MEDYRGQHGLCPYHTWTRTNEIQALFGQLQPWYGFFFPPSGTSVHVVEVTAELAVGGIVGSVEHRLEGVLHDGG